MDENSVKRGGKSRCGYLHVWVVGAPATFWHHPVDVLRRILDVTGFTVDTVLGVDLKPGVAILLDIFVDTGRAKTGLRPIIVRKVDGERHRAVF